MRSVKRVGSQKPGVAPIVLLEPITSRLSKDRKAASVSLKAYTKNSGYMALKKSKAPEQHKQLTTKLLAEKKDNEAELAQTLAT